MYKQFIDWRSSGLFMPTWGCFCDFDQQSRSDWPGFGMRSGFISMSVRTR